MSASLLFILILISVCHAFVGQLFPFIPKSNSLVYPNGELIHTDVGMTGLKLLWNMTFGEELPTIPPLLLGLTGLGGSNSLDPLLGSSASTVTTGTSPGLGSVPGIPGTAGTTDLGNLGGLTGLGDLTNIGNLGGLTNIGNLGGLTGQSGLTNLGGLGTLGSLGSLGSGTPFALGAKNYVPPSNMPIPLLNIFTTEKPVVTISEAYFLPSNEKNEEEDKEEEKEEEDDAIEENLLTNDEEWNLRKSLPSCDYCDWKLSLFSQSSVLSKFNENGCLTLGCLDEESFLVSDFSGQAYWKHLTCNEGYWFDSTGLRVKLSRIGCAKKFQRTKEENQKNEGSGQDDWDGSGQQILEFR